eukprot:Gb_26819 [translate_table: standard]
MRFLCYPASELPFGDFLASLKLCGTAKEGQTRPESYERVMFLLKQASTSPGEGFRGVDYYKILIDIFSIFHDLLLLLRGPALGITSGTQDGWATPDCPRCPVDIITRAHAIAHPSMGYIDNPEGMLLLLKAVLEASSYRIILFSAGHPPLDTAIQAFGGEHLATDKIHDASSNDHQGNLKLIKDGLLLFNNRLFCYAGSSSIPYSWLFPKCSVAIHHGGSGTTAAALRAGIPQTLECGSASESNRPVVLVSQGLGVDSTTTKELEKKKKKNMVPKLQIPTPKREDKKMDFPIEESTQRLHKSDKEEINSALNAKANEDLLATNADHKQSAETMVDARFFTEDVSLKEKGVVRPSMEERPQEEIKVEHWAEIGRTLGKSD